MRRARGRVPFRSGRGLHTSRVLTAAASLTVLLAAGCAGASAGGTVSSTVTIAAVPGVDTAPLYLARRDGMFAAAGLTNVVIQRYATQAAALGAVSSGKADIAASDYGDIFYAQSKNPELRILSDGYDAGTGVLEVLTPKDSAITSPAALAGANIGVPEDQVLPAGAGGPGSLDAAAAADVLTNFLGNNVGSIHWIPMSPQQEVAAMQNGNSGVAAVLVSEPYIYEAESQFGASEILDACSGSTANLPLAGYVATQAWVKGNAAAAADFQAAIGHAQAQAAMTGQIQQILPGITGMSVAEADLSTIGSYPTSTSAISLERVVQLMSNHNIILPASAPAVPPMIVGSGS